MARQMFGRRSPQDEALEEVMGDTAGMTDAAQSPFAAAARNRTQMPGMHAPAQPQENPYANFDQGSQIPTSRGGLGLGASPMMQPQRSTNIGMPSSQVGQPSDMVRDAASRGITGGVPSGPAGQIMPQSDPTRGANAPPSTPGALGQYSGSLEGFDSGKLNSAHDSPKYQIARILSKYPPTPEGLQQAMPEIQASGLADSVSLVGNDKLQFGGQMDPRFEGLNTFDVLRGADAGGMGWQWAPEGGGANADPSMGGGGGMAGGQGGSDPFAQLGVLQQQAAAGDSYSAQVLQMLMQELGLNQALGR